MYRPGFVEKDETTDYTENLHTMSNQADAKYKAVSIKLSQVEANLKQKERLINRLQNEKQELLRSMTGETQATHKLACRDDELFRIRSELSETTDQLNKCVEELLTHRRASGSIDGERAAWRVEQQELQERIRVIERSAANDSAAYKRTHAQLDALQKSASADREEITRLQADLNNSRTERDHAFINLQSSEAAKEQLRAKLEAANRDIGQYNTSISQLESKCASLEEENNDISSRLGNNSIGGFSAEQVELLEMNCTTPQAFQEHTESRILQILTDHSTVKQELIDKYSAEVKLLRNKLSRYEPHTVANNTYNSRQEVSYKQEVSPTYQQYNVFSTRPTHHEGSYQKLENRYPEQMQRISALPPTATSPRLVSNTQTTAPIRSQGYGYSPYSSGVTQKPCDIHTGDMRSNQYNKPMEQPLYASSVHY